MADDSIKVLLRLLPAVDEMLKNPSLVPLTQSIPRPLLLQAIRDTLTQLREDLLEGVLDTKTAPHTKDDFTDLMLKRLISQKRSLSRSNLRPLINATGVVLHTNLGRSILGEYAVKAIHDAAVGYTNLELDLSTGKRGSRYAPVEQLLTKLTGAEGALVVNNNAGAVLLALSTLAKGQEVIVSRGQLVEIGGAFRIPEVMAQSGAHLIEVGATNKTYPADYQKAVTEDTALLLHVHTSNYRIIGFTRETSVAELVSLGLPVMSDLGSGSLVDFSSFGLPAEPTVQQVVKEGAHVVTFSGDKLLGGPQAGIIVGKKEYIDRMKSNPLNRALRIDKFTVAALEATLRQYLEPNTMWEKIPTLNMLTVDNNVLKQRAQDLSTRLSTECGQWAIFSVIQTDSAVGGGAMPTAQLPSWGVEVAPVEMSAFTLSGLLRDEDPAVIGRLQDNKLLMDMRTILPDQEAPLLLSLAGALKGGVSL